MRLGVGSKTYVFWSIDRAPWCPAGWNLAIRVGPTRLRLAGAWHGGRMLWASDNRSRERQDIMDRVASSNHALPLLCIAGGL